MTHLPVRDHVPASAVAKARLLTLLLNRASSAGMALPTQAVLARLIADSYWSARDQAWVLQAAKVTLAHRLCCSADTVSDHVDRLVAAKIIAVVEGDGRRSSLYLLRDLPAVALNRRSELQGGDASHDRSQADHRGGENSPPLPKLATIEGGRILRPRGGEFTPPGGENSPPVSVKLTEEETAAAAALRPHCALTETNDRRDEQPSSPANSHAAAAGEILFKRSSSQQPTPADLLLAAVMAVRPHWLPQGRSWITEETALELLANHEISSADVYRALVETQPGAARVNNPAGIFITHLRRKARGTRDWDAEMRRAWTIAKQRAQEAGLSLGDGVTDPHNLFGRDRARRAVYERLQAKGGAS